MKTSPQQFLMRSKAFSRFLLSICLTGQAFVARANQVALNGKPAAALIQALQLAGVHETLARTTMYSVASIDCSKGNDDGLDPQSDWYLLGHDFVCTIPLVQDQAAAKAFIDGLQAAGVRPQTTGGQDRYALPLLQCEINRSEQTMQNRFVCMISMPPTAN